MLHEDWIMKQIRIGVRMLAKLLCGADTPRYELIDANADTRVDVLYLRLSALLEKGRYNEAENELYDGFLPDDRDFLLLALAFYDRLNDLTDEQLEAGDFSREEVADGVREIAKRYGAEQLVDL